LYVLLDTIALALVVAVPRQRALVAAVHAVELADDYYSALCAFWTPWNDVRLFAVDGSSCDVRERIP
jgi:uncharacterized membrane protein